MPARTRFHDTRPYRTLFSMSTMRILPVGAAASLVVMLALSSCAPMPAAPAPASSDAPAGDSLSALTPTPPEGEVVGTGTVMDIDGSVELCMGAVAESYPPQCSGVPLEGWTWDGIDDSQASGLTRWGTYAVTGTYDGTVFTVSRAPIPLALHDPMAPVDPTGGEPGAASETELQTIQEELPARFGETATSIDSYTANGRLWVHVVWDDGTLQRAADADFGEDVVIIRSALRAVEG